MELLNQKKLFKPRIDPDFRGFEIEAIHLFKPLVTCFRLIKDYIANLRNRRLN